MILYTGTFLIAFAPLLIAAMLRLRVLYLILSAAAGFLAAALLQYWAAFASSATIGVLTGQDRVFHDTYYTIAQGHYDLSLGLLMTALGAGQWLKERFSGQADETGTRWAFWALVAGILGAQLPYLYLSTIGMPRRYVDYPEVFGFWNSVATVSSFFAFSALVTLVGLMTALPLWRWLRLRG